MNRNIILKIALPVLIFSLLLYLPFILNPTLLLSRGNDLTEFFWPLIYYVKKQILLNHEISLWNTMFFSGTPLFPDPQNPVFYFPNIIFLFTSIDTGFLISFFLHFVFGGIGTYITSRKVFKLSKIASLFVALLFALSPKYAGYLEAGHYGLITSWAWLPWVILATVEIRPILLSISLAAIFYSHILTFGIVLASNVILFLVSRKFSIKRVVLFCLSYLILLTLIAPILMAQLSWVKDTTRDLLLKMPDIYPIWNGKVEFIKNIFIGSRDTEKDIMLGIVPLFFAFFGFIKIKRRTKIILSATALIIIFVSLNNVSPLNNFFLKQNWFLLLRVATRGWFVIILTTIFLAGYGFDYLVRHRPKFFIIIAALGIIEYLFASYFILTKPIVATESLPQEAYQFFEKDKDIYRIFCLTRCIPQREAAIHHLELVEGYGTLQQKNYYYQSQQLAQAYWRNRYTLSIPPIEIYVYENLQPIATELASYRVKYLISKHQLNDKKLKVVIKFDEYLIYQNLLFKNPNYLIYKPNFIKVDTSNFKGLELVIPEVYNKNWHAYLNGKEEITVFETRQATRKVFINKDTTFVDFKYQPWQF